MDTETGRIYPSKEIAEKHLRGLGVPEEEIKRRIVQYTGSKNQLRHIRKKLKKGGR
jgi:hypothetical protein